MYCISFLFVVKNCNRCDPTAVHAVCTAGTLALLLRFDDEFQGKEATLSHLIFQVLKKNLKKVLTFAIQSIYITHSPSIRRGFCSLKN